MTQVRRVLIAVFVAGAAPFVFAQPAAALSCVDPGDVMRSSTSVFTGRITDADRREALIRVDTVWKGAVGREVRVKLDWFEGFDPRPTVGRRYTVAVHQDEPANNCSMWPASGLHVRDAVAQVFTEPVQRYSVEPAEEASDDRAPIALMVVGGLATLSFGAAVAWRLSQRRRA